MWREQDYLHPRALLGYFPCYSEGNEHRRARPAGPQSSELTRLVFPRQPAGDRICLADFFRPAGGSRRSELDVVALQAVTVGGEVTELMAALEAEGEFAEQLFVHGLGVQTAEGTRRVAARTSARASSASRRPRAGATRGATRPVPTSPSTGRSSRCWTSQQIGMSSPTAARSTPEQSTLAIVAHHPQAVYFGTRQGRLTPDGSPDEVIIGSDRDPTMAGGARRR